MKTVGSILKEARLAKNLTLADVEKVTKIRAKFLDAIEQDAYHVLPSPIYAKGFVKNYGEYLGLESTRVMAFFRRQTVDVKRSAILPHKDEDIGSKALRITPGRFIALIISSFILVFLVYFGFQYQKLYMAPTLTITTPAQESIVKEKKLDILGSTNPDATVTVNGVSVTVRSDGRFFTQITAEPGVNTITILATSRFGKTTTVIRKVGFQQ
jgi:cytoskeletal protein RodZ